MGGGRGGDGRYRYPLSTAVNQALPGRRAIKHLSGIVGSPGGPGLIHELFGTTQGGGEGGWR